MSDTPTWDSEELVRRLTEEFGYMDYEADYTVDALGATDPAVQGWLATWLTTTSIVTPRVAGYNLEDLMTTRMFASPAAGLLMLDWLLRDPNKATSSLSRPVDRVVPPSKSTEFART